MRTYILRGLLPWIILFAFADGSAQGLFYAAIGGLLVLFIFNFYSLKKFFLLGWVTLLFFIVMLFISFAWPESILVKYDLLIANAVLTVLCFTTLIARRPFSLPYAKMLTAKIYWQHPLFIIVNYWITAVWGLAFLFYTILIILFMLGIGNKLWMLQILPVAALVFAIGFMVLFPDYYRRRATRQGTVASLPNISVIKTVNFGNVQIGYRLLGQGPLLVMVPGALMNMHHWDPDMLAQLSKNFQVLLFDYPGVGYSSYQNMPFTAEKLADCLYNLIDKLQLQIKAIVGYSMGGWIAQKYAVKYSQNVAALVLIGTTCGGPNAVWCDKTVEQKLETCVSDDISSEEQFANMMSVMFPQLIIPRIFNKIMKIFVAAVLEGTPKKKMVQLERQIIDDWRIDNQLVKQISELDLPVLIISGLQDVVMPPENAKLLQTKFSNSKLLEYDDAGHGVIYQYPLDIADNIRDFLQI
jgi:pimeloyl-ACP methyl ester carboxylesterase